MEYSCEATSKVTHLLPEANLRLRLKVIAIRESKLGTSSGLLCAVFASLHFSCGSRKIPTFGGATGFGVSGGGDCVLWAGLKNAGALAGAAVRLE